MLTDSLLTKDGNKEKVSFGRLAVFSVHTSKSSGSIPVTVQGVALGVGAIVLSHVFVNLTGNAESTRNTRNPEMAGCNPGQIRVLPFRWHFGRSIEPEILQGGQ